jgi:hypothetical protein
MPRPREACREPKERARLKRHPQTNRASVKGSGMKVGESKVSAREGPASTGETFPRRNF